MTALLFSNGRRGVTRIVGVHRRRVGPDKGPNDLVVFGVSAHLALILLREADEGELPEEPVLPQPATY